MWKETWPVAKRLGKIEGALKGCGWRWSVSRSSVSESRYIRAWQGNKTLTVRVSDHMYCSGVQKAMLNVCPGGHTLSDVLQFLRDPSIPVRNIYYERKLARKRLKAFEKEFSSYEEDFRNF